jgi:type VI secretion system lysozyme-like protein
MFYQQHGSGINRPLLSRFCDDVSATPIAILHDDIKRNVAMLLNTRSSCFQWSADCALLSGSLVNYGIEDFSHESFGCEKMQRKLCQNILRAIQYFEPRLSDVDVRFVENEIEIKRVLQLHISARVKTQPVSSAVFVMDLFLSGFQQLGRNRPQAAEIAFFKIQA